MEMIRNNRIMNDQLFFVCFLSEFSKIIKFLEMLNIVVFQLLNKSWYKIIQYLKKKKKCSQQHPERWI
jgi:hypothetical protein